MPPRDLVCSVVGSDDRLGLFQVRFRPATAVGAPGSETPGRVAPYFVRTGDQANQNSCAGLRVRFRCPLPSVFMT